MKILSIKPLLSNNPDDYCKGCGHYLVCYCGFD